MIGSISGINVGQTFLDRRALHDANVHRGLVQGIAPHGNSIVLSGGYVDDEDEGDRIIYTGHGGRDEITGRQIADQSLTRYNAALAKNYAEGNPIRVNRGHQLDSPYAPEQGYRYDGLYRIDRYWSERGRDGFIVWRFFLVRLEGQSPIGTLETESQTTGDQLQNIGTDRPGRSFTTVSRVIRNTRIGNEIKRLYEYKCQICSQLLETPSGLYAECCHIRPLGRPHNGPDTIDNVLCLCPNHHVLFDSHAIHISNELTVVESGERISIHTDHNISIDNLNYHRSLSMGLNDY